MISTNLLMLYLFGSLALCDGSYITDQIGPISESLWEKVSLEYPIVSSSHLATFFKRYGNSSNLILGVLDFLNGEVSWLTDFGEFIPQETGIEHGQAYFRTLDVILEMFSRRLTIADMDELIDICEKSSGSGGTGVIDRNQFVSGFEKLVFRCLPFSYMFGNYKPVQLFPVYENLKKDDFMNIFNDTDANSDNLVDEDEMGQFWEEGSYDVGGTGRELFKKLDHQNKGSLTRDDWMDLFEELDCRSDFTTDLLDVFEFFQLDLILADVRNYPGGECILKRL